MSAVTQRAHHSPAPSGRQRTKLVIRPRGYHHACTRAEVIAKYQDSKWAGRALDLHLCRVTSGTAQIAWIRFVYSHTTGSPDAKERRMDFSPVLLPEDAAKEFGLSVQMMREACNECVARGFTPRYSTKREDGKDFYRFQVDFGKIAEAPNAWQTRGGAFVPRKPVQAEGEREEKANFVDFKTTYAASRESAIAPNAPVLEAGKAAADGKPAGPTAVAADLARPAKTVEVSHSLPLAVAVSCALSVRGKLQIHLSPPSEHYPAVEQPSVESATPIRPSPFGTALEPFLDRLAQLGTPVNDDMLVRLKREIRCAPGYFLEEVDDAVRRGTKKGRVISTSMLPAILAQANQKWKRGAKKTWEAGGGRSAPE